MLTLNDEGKNFPDLIMDVTIRFFGMEVIWLIAKPEELGSFPLQRLLM